MAHGDNSPGMSRLAGVLRWMAKGTGGGQALDFGTIQANGGLLTDHYPIIIPKGDYLVCRHLVGRIAATSEVNSHSHSVQTQRTLTAGSRVLVAWVDNDAVVVDVIVNADSAL